MKDVSHFMVCFGRFSLSISLVFSGVLAARCQNPNIVFEQSINKIEGGGIPDIGNGDWFGYAVAPIGDLDQDGVQDIAVGAIYDDDGGLNRGALYILFMNSNATVGSYQKISQLQGGFQGLLVDESFFGSDIANVGDLDGNGVQDLVVGASGDDDGGSWAGAVWVLFMNSDGTVADQQKISALTGWPSSPLGAGDRFGKGVDSIGDLNSDGVIDIIVGAHEDDDGGTNHGAAYILFLNPDGTVQSHSKISEITPGFNGNLTNSANFGWSVACLGDPNSDGYTDILIGAMQDDVLGTDDGSAWIVSVTSAGQLTGCVELSRATSPILASTISSGDKFGSSVTRGFSMWCDDTDDVIIGAMFYGNGSEGGVLLVDIDDSFQVQHVQTIAEGMANFQDNLNSSDLFGRASHLITDYDGNGFPDLMVGAVNFDAGGSNTGGTWILSLDKLDTISVLPEILQTCEDVPLSIYPDQPIIDALWSTGETSDTISVQDPGTIWLSGSLGQCIVNDTVQVMVLPLPELNLGNDTTACEPFAIQVDNSGYQVDWSTGSSSTSVLVSSSNEYWVSLTGTCGIFTDTLNVEILEPIQFSLGSDTILCIGSEFVLSPTIIAGSPEEFLWYNGSAEQQDTVNSNGTFWLTLSDECSSISDTISVSLGYEPSLQLPSDTLICANSGELMATAVTYGTYSAFWNNGQQGLFTQIDSSGYYILSLNDICGSAADSINVTLFNSLVLQLPSDTAICDGEQVIVMPSASWDEILGFVWSDNSTDTTISISNEGEYWIDAFTECGVVSDTLEVLVSSGPVIELGHDTILCASELIIYPSVSTTGEAFYEWSSGETSESIIVEDQGLYWVQISDQCGVASDSISVQFISGPVSITLPDNYLLCAGDTIMITAEVSDPRVDVTWSNGQSGVSIAISSSAQYVASVSEACGGDADTTRVLRVGQEYAYGSLHYEPCGTQVILRADSIKQYSGLLLPLQPTYLWNTGSMDTVIIVEESGNYWLARKGYCGTDTVHFNVELNECWENSLPNVITPNDDGLNDVFVPVSMECSTCPYRLRIYNRWGLLVFDEMNEPWDGKLKSGPLVVSGVYYYLFEFGGKTETGYLEVIP